jgi:catechol 2,3-dioxygenase
LKVISHKMNPQTTIGHIHLTVTDIDRALSFYRDLLGFEITARIKGRDGKDSAVFLSAGGYHHHIALNTWAGPDAKPAPKGLGHAGLYHFAILFPTRRDLALALKRLMDANYPIHGSADHGVSEAIYLDDPDGNGVELYADRPRETWTVSNDGEVEMVSKALDLQSLLGEL